MLKFVITGVYSDYDELWLEQTLLDFIETPFNGGNQDYKCNRHNIGYSHQNIFHFTKGFVNRGDFHHSH